MQGTIPPLNFQEETIQQPITTLGPVNVGGLNMPAWPFQPTVAGVISQQVLIGVVVAVVSGAVVLMLKKKKG